MQQLVAQIEEDVFFSVPWGHHLYIISQCKDVDKAIFYLNQTVELMSEDVKSQLPTIEDIEATLSSGE